VDPAAQGTLDPASAGRLRSKVEASDAGPVYIAVLPADAKAEAGGSTDGVVSRLVRAAGRQGTYIVVVGTELRAGSTAGTPFGEGIVPSLATDAVAAHRGQGAEAVLTDLVNRLAEVASGESEPGGSQNGGPEGGSRGSGAGGLVGLLAVAGIGGGAVVVARRRRRQRESAELEEVRKTVLDDLVALGEALRSIDLDVRMPGAKPEAARDYERALALYEQASGALDRARRPQDVASVTAAIDEGRYLVESAKARIEGREPPERRPPCFFDPRHGPSVQDVEWSPPNGAARTIPVCAADAQRIADGIDPEPRRVGVGGSEVPYWDAPRYYGPWYGGYFGGGGLLQGFLLGSLLTGGFHSPYGYGDQGAGSDFGDFGGGGDFG
jgi:hypothetical protein